MYKIAAIPSFKRPIALKLADGSEVEFTAVYKLHDQDELNTLIAESKSDADMARRTIVAFEDVADENGQALPALSALDRLLKMVGMDTALAMEFLAGNRVAPRKN
jgi:hypothetical protein